jgi:hypothetical protein
MIWRYTKLFAAAAVAALCLSWPAAAAQDVSCTGPTGANCVPVVNYTASGVINAGNPLAVSSAPVAPAAGTAGAGYPPGATAISGNATGSTGAVVGTLAANATKFTYICGFNVSAIGATATVGPVVVAGLITASQTYQVPVNSATNATVLGPFNFTPCIQSSAINTAITITTTANGTASAVDVNSWGFQQ